MEDRPPVVDRRRAGVAEGGGDRLEVGEGGDRLLDHALEVAHVEGGEVLVEPLDLEAQGGREVLLVAEHDVDEGGELAVDLAGPFSPPDGLPQRRAVVEVVGDEGPVPACRGHGLPGDRGGRLREGGEDAAGVEPPGALVPEDRVPVDLAGTQLGDGGVAAVGASEGGPHPEAALGEVEAVPDGAPDAVVGHPADVGRVDAPLVDEVLEEVAHRVVHEGGDHRGALPEAAFEATGHVVLPAALPRPELAGGVDAEVAGVEAQHDLAEADEVEAAVGGGLQR